MGQRTDDESGRVVAGRPARTAERDAVAPDGSPVAVYLALPVEPADPEFSPVLEAVAGRAPGCSVLDLGCGVGRLANALAERGFAVTGVDESAAMLAHVRPGVVCIEARLEGLRLGRRFDIVVLASQLVNSGEPRARAAFLRTAAAHVRRTGEVFIEHYDAAWLRSLFGADELERAVGDVRFAFRVTAHRGDDFDGRVRYTVGGDTWLQEFSGRVLDDAALRTALAGAGLRVRRRLGPTWLVAEAVTPRC
jgi:SAM-dependent methyltransferase